MKKSKFILKTPLILTIFSCSVLAVSVSAGITLAAYQAIHTVNITEDGTEGPLKISSNGKRDTSIIFHVHLENGEWYYGSANTYFNIETNFWCSEDNSWANCRMQCYTSRDQFTVSYKIDYFKVKYDKVNVKRTQPGSGTVWNKTFDIDLYGGDGEPTTYIDGKTLNLYVTNAGKNEYGDYTLTKHRA